MAHLMLSLTDIIHCFIKLGAKIVSLILMMMNLMMMMKEGLA
jgi:hypothetical protein